MLELALRIDSITVSTSYPLSNHELAGSLDLGRGAS
jgi:hypothetical protein